jgi:hypothetical protein
MAAQSEMVGGTMTASDSGDLASATRSASVPGARALVRLLGLELVSRSGGPAWLDFLGLAKVFWAALCTGLVRLSFSKLIQLLQI